MSRGAWRVAVTIMAAVACAAVLWGTPHGIGLSGDSPVYIGVARTLLAGEGVIYLNDAGGFSPVSHYPPLYPTAIAVAALPDGDPLTAARYLNAFLFAGNVALAACVALAAAPWRGAALAAAFLMSVALPMVQVHSMAWSEPLFILLGFSGLWLLASFFERNEAWRLSGAAVIVGFSCLVRYAGVALLCAGGLGILLADRLDRSRRWRDLLVFLVLGALAPALWVARNQWLAGSATNRVPGFYPPGIEAVINAADNICLWFFPAGILALPLWARAATAGLVALIALGAARAWSDNRLMRLVSFFLGAYLLFVLAARCFFDPHIRFDNRILAPAYPAAMILVVMTASAWVRAKAQSRALAPRLFLGLSIAAVLALQSGSALAWWKQSRRSGIGFGELSWTNSEVLKMIDRAERPDLVFTNVPDLVYMWTGKRVSMIPNKRDPDSRLPNARYRDEIAAMRQALNNEHALVAYYHAEGRLWFLPSADELEREAGLRLFARDRHARAYRLD